MYPYVRTMLNLYLLCTYSQGLKLNEKKLKILSYVESRMSFIAPNLSTIVGPTVATKLMGKEQVACTRYMYIYKYMYALFIQQFGFTLIHAHSRNTLYMYLFAISVTCINTEMKNKKEK